MHSSSNFCVAVAFIAGFFGSGVAFAQPEFTQHPATKQISNNSTVVFSATAPTATNFQWTRNSAPIADSTRSTLVIFGATRADAGAYAVVAANAAGRATSLAANLNIAVGNDFGRLSNLSILTDLTATTTDFTLGTVIGGANTTGDKPLLIRAVGPSLAQINVAGVLVDSKLDLYSGQSVIATNDDWGGDPQLTQAGARVGAFRIENAQSTDAMLLLTLTPGNYTAEVRGVSGGGAALVEVYEVP